MSIVDQHVQRLSMEAALRRLLRIENSYASNIGLHEKLLSLEQKLVSNQLHLAVLGQMKRGKSSFINALLGAKILPTGVLPVTSVITKIKAPSVIRTEEFDLALEASESCISLNRPSISATT